MKHHTYIPTKDMGCAR